MKTEITLIANEANPLEVVVIKYREQIMVTGSLIGLASIVTEQIGAAGMSVKCSPINIREVNVVDWRQTLPYGQGARRLHFLSVGIYSDGQWIPWKMSRYVVLAPRQLMAPKVTWSDLMQRMLLLVLILATALGFLGLRLICRHIDPSHPVDNVDLLFDTFARTLGISAGTWMGRSRAERQLLVVASVFAFLMGSVLSGVLYKRTINQEYVQRFKTLQDLCDAGIRVTFQGHSMFSVHSMMQAESRQ